MAQRFRTSQCTRDHEHAHWINDRPKACEVYPHRFCQYICMGIKEELVDKLHESNGNEYAMVSLVDQGSEDNMRHPHDDTVGYIHLCQKKGFYDDLAGQHLDKDRAVVARKLEVDFFRSVRVYSKVLRAEAKKNGAKIATIRWIDVSTGHRDNPDCGSRLVGREVKRCQRFDLLAATHPSEALRMIVGMCASNQAKNNPYRILTSDVKRAYFFAKATRPEIPLQDREGVTVSMSEDWALASMELAAQHSIGNPGSQISW